MNPKHSLYLLLPFFTTFTWCLPTPSLELDDPSTALAARNAGGIDLTKRQAQIAGMLTLSSSVAARLTDHPSRHSNCRRSRGCGERNRTQQWRL